MDFFETVNDFISKALENNDNVVVHCISGISRSSTLVIGNYQHMSFVYLFYNLVNPLKHLYPV